MHECYLSNTNFTTEISSHTSLADPSTVFLNFWRGPVCENPVTTLNRGPKQ